MDAALRHIYLIFLCVSCTVSILVLMDAALRQTPSGGYHAYFESFNPCFDGCRPATQFELFVSRVVNIVSILVLMDAALRLKSKNRY